jgi:outer membrane murein-binding lipoprotein Lpp
MYCGARERSTRAHGRYVRQQRVYSVEITILITVGVLAVLLGVALGGYVWPTIPEDQRAALASAQAGIAQLDKECSTLRGQARQLESESKAASQKARTAGEESARLSERVVGITK